MKQFLIILLIPFYAGALDKVNLRVDGHLLKVEVAATVEEKRVGLMNRKNLPENEGMMFIFSPPEPAAFWMKNTLIPLSLAFVDENLRIVKLNDLNPPVSVVQRDPARAESDGPVLMVIEVNQGWFKKKKISLNAKVELAEKTKNPLLSKIFNNQAGQKSSDSPAH